METIFPTEPGFSGLFGVGFRKEPTGSGATQRVGFVVVKRTYTAVGGQLQPDANGEAVLITDETSPHNGMAFVTRESDIAPFKPEGDLVVVGFHPVGHAGSVRINGVLWLQRPEHSEIPDDPDSSSNLFGWEQRFRSPRVRDTGYDPATESGGFYAGPDSDDYYPSQWPVPAGQPGRDPLHPAGFSNLFFNAHRRKPWKQLDTFPYFTGTPEVVITDSHGTDSEEFRFNICDEPLNAGFEYYCGHGPDRASRWCTQDITLVRDTLVVEPGMPRVCLLWRAVWDFDLVPVQWYRRCRVQLEA